MGQAGYQSLAYAGYLAVIRFLNRLEDDGPSVGSWASGWNQQFRCIIKKPAGLKGRYFCYLIY